MALQHFYSGKIKWKFKKRNKSPSTAQSICSSILPKSRKPTPNPPFSRETFQSTAIGAASRLPASAIGVGIFLRLDSQSNNSPICPSLRDWAITLFRVILPWVVGWRFGICRWTCSNMCFFRKKWPKKTHKKAQKMSLWIYHSEKKKLMSRVLGKSLAPMLLTNASTKHIDTVDGSEIVHRLGCIKVCK